MIPRCTHWEQALPDGNQPSQCICEWQWQLHTKLSLRFYQHIIQQGGWNSFTLFPSVFFPPFFLSLEEKLQIIAAIFIVRKGKEYFCFNRLKPLLSAMPSSEKLYDAHLKMEMGETKGNEESWGKKIHVFSFCVGLCVFAQTRPAERNMVSCFVSEGLLLLFMSGQKQ